MKNTIINLIFIGFSTLILGQEITNINDLKNELQNELVDTTKVSIKLKIANQFLKSNNDSVIFYYNEALELANKIDSKPQMAKLFYNIGIFYEENNNFEKAIKNYLEASVIFKKLNNIKEEAKLYDYIGYNYLQLYAQDKAIEYYLKSLNLHKNIVYDEGIGINYTSIGDLFYSQGDYDIATKYFKDALEIYKKNGLKNDIAISYTNLGNSIADGGNNEEGLAYYKKSIEIQEELDDQLGIGINYNNIGDCYINLKEYSKAFDYFLKSLNIANKLDDESLISVVLLNIADVQLKVNKYSSAILFATRSLTVAKEIGDLEYQASNLTILSNAYEHIGNISKAYNYNKQYIEIKDSLINIDRTNKVKLFQALNELEANNYTIDELSTKNEITKTKYEANKKFIYFLIGAIVLSVFFVILLILQQTSKKKAYNLLEYKNHQINKMNDEIQVQRDHLKQLNATKDQFFSIIAHDLKNPFNSIKGFTELMIENSHEYDEEKRVKFLKIIKGSTTRVLSLIDNLLIWANSQSGNLKFVPRKVELIQTVSDIISLVEIQAINKEIKIISSVDNTVFVDADENMLETILRNLVSNAIKFTKVKGEVQIFASINSNFAKITVKDNGVGISQSDIDNLFSIEVKNSNVGTANEQGSGLGLILCKDFVEKHGGKLWVKSSVNEGSEFKFTIPIAI